jgi:hypothetical protein
VSEKGKRDSSGDYSTILWWGCRKELFLLVSRQQDSYI